MPAPDGCEKSLLGGWHRAVALSKASRAASRPKQVTIPASQPLHSMQSPWRDDPCIHKGRSIFHRCPGVKRLSWEGSCRWFLVGEERWHGKPL